VVAAFVAIDKILKEEGDIPHLMVATLAQLARHVGGNVL
jgi:hypothetical protein